ncbi:MAG: ExbD/TolR family protein [Herminiimonas sp.]|nr:ExbD/TolR family protein [Herminiimonas sp.]
MSGGFSSMRGGRTRKFKAEINVVPYIDVMLVLLVIFMVAAPLTNPSVVNLPSAGKSSMPPTEYIQIQLKSDTTATISIAGQKSGGAKPETAANAAALGRQLKALHLANPDLPVMIAADKDIKYDEVMKAMAQAKQVGIGRIGLATK